MSGSETEEELKREVARYLELERVEQHRAYVTSLVEAGEWRVLEEQMRPLEFGTAGLRAEMGAGFGRMNELTVVQATQGVCAHMLATQDAHAPQRGVVIGHDHRHNSRLFARLAAAVFLSQGVRVHLFDTLVHTPLVPFAIRRLNAALGIMITASHNPKNDNGYKLYGPLAAQIIPPVDKLIQQHIARLQLPRVWDHSLPDSHPLCSTIPPNLIDDYFQNITALSQMLDLNTARPLKVVYTAMHGVGTPYVERAFKACSLQPFIPVPQQCSPNPDFPTVKYPNPEEGANALLLASETADAHGATLILANDPDADRLAVAEKQPSGEWRAFTGNEIGAMFGRALWEHVQRTPDSKCAMLCTVVSSKLLKKMASVEGFRHEETLTGFKWLGNRAIELEAEGYQVLFAFEEAIGFMVGTTVYDKDGVSAAAIFAKLAAHLYSSGTTLTQYLNEIYTNYNPSVTRTIFNQFRFGQDNPSDLGAFTYPTTIALYPVLTLHDYANDYRYDASTPSTPPPNPLFKIPSSHMISVSVRADTDVIVHVTVRTSGTEPKIKYYSEIIDTLVPVLSNDQEREERKKRVDAMVRRVVDAMMVVWLKPSVYGLTPKSSA